MKSKAPPSEFAFEKTSEWTVVPKFKFLTKKQRELKKQPELSHYELQFDGVCQDKATTEIRTQKLREFAAFLNRRKMIPRDRIECAADAPNPSEYLKKLSR